MNRAILRPANPNEAEQLSRLAYRSKAYWGYSADFMTTCKHELSVSCGDIEDSRCHYVIAELNYAPVGFYALGMSCATNAELLALFVEPEHIGTGIGGILIDAAKQYAAERGASTLTIQGDPNAAGFYIRAGGVQTGTRESGSIPGRFLPVFQISLTAS